MNSWRKYLAVAAGAAAVLACAPAAALGAVSATITGDAGTPVALNPAAPPALTNMHPTAAVHLDAPDAMSYIWTVTDPGGAQVAETDFYCWHPAYTPDENYPVTYHGNGTYTLHIQTFSDDNCKTATGTLNYAFTIAAGVALAPTGGTYLLGQTLQFDSAIPANGTADYVYGLNAAVQADGSLAGTTQPAFRDPTTGKVAVTPTVPGSYTMVGHASYDATNFTPWSAPVTFRVLQKFALSGLTFPRNRAPHFQLRGVVPYGSGGKVTVSQAFGKHGKHFRTLGRGKLSSKGVFKVNFTNRKVGWYRFRFSYKGSGSVAKGVIYLSAKLRRL